jgi:hypothetical protein
MRPLVWICIALYTFAMLAVYRTAHFIVAEFGAIGGLAPTAAMYGAAVYWERRRERKKIDTFAAFSKQSRCEVTRSAVTPFRRRKTFAFRHRKVVVRTNFARSTGRSDFSSPCFPYASQTRFSGKRGDKIKP